MTISRNTGQWIDNGTCERCRGHGNDSHNKDLFWRANYRQRTPLRWQTYFSRQLIRQSRLQARHQQQQQLYRPYAMGRHLQQHRATTAFGTSSTTTSGNHTNHSPRKAIDNHGTKMGRRLYVWFDHVTILNETTILLISHYVFSSTTIISLHMGLISNYSPNVFM